jgi:phage shock protein A
MSDWDDGTVEGLQDRIATLEAEVAELRQKARDVKGWGTEVRILTAQVEMLFGYMNNPETVQEKLDEIREKLAAREARDD